MSLQVCQELHNIISGNNPPAQTQEGGGTDGENTDGGGGDNNDGGGGGDTTPANPNPNTNTSFNADGDNNWATNNIVNPNTGGGRGGRNYSTPFGNINLTEEQLEAINRAERGGRP